MKSERRDDGAWARPVDRLTADGGHINVTGRRPTAPMNGFGRMWQKTYKTSLGAIPASGAKKRLPDGQNSGKCAFQAAITSTGVTVAAPSDVR